MKTTKEIYKRVASTLAVLILLVSLGACEKSDDNNEQIVLKKPDQAALKTKIVDKNATNETFALFYNLRYYPQSNVLFGHQSDNLTGFDGNTSWKVGSSEEDRSDVKSVLGTYPAVNGFDFLDITNPNPKFSADILKQQTINAYNRGQVISYSWHYTNPVNKGSYFWKENPVNAVSEILPGGALNGEFKAALKAIADFNVQLIGKDGKQIPVIFRPFPRNDNPVYWWGNLHCTADEYVELYRYTVDQLKTLGVHNFLYAYAPDNFKPDEKGPQATRSIQCYPGDEYVDIVGINNHFEAFMPFYAELGRQLRYLVSFAADHDKIPALTEVSNNNLKNKVWFCDILHRAMLMEGLGVANRSLAYVMLGANEGTSYTTPYKGTQSESDFKNFKNKGYALFNDNAPNMYVIR